MEKIGRSVFETLSPLGFESSSKPSSLKKASPPSNLRIYWIDNSFCQEIL